MASGVDLTDKLSKLRGMMTLHQPSVDYYIISNQDAHGSPLVGESEKRLQWISGFSSLRGVAVVSQQAAHIFVEASDLAQAEAELSLEDWFVIPIEGIETSTYWISWLANHAYEASIGLDARHVWHDQAVFLKSLAVVNKSKLVPVYQNLVDVIWEDKPQRGEEVVSVHPIEVPDPYNRLTQIRQWIRAQPASFSVKPTGESCYEKPTAALMVSPSSIAFALHLTGKPMFQSYLFIGLQSCTLFVDSEIEDSSPLHLHLQGIGVTTRKHNDLYDFLREREWGAGKVLVPPKMSHAIAIFLTTPSTPLYTVAPSFVDHLKALEEPMRDSILIWKKHSHRLFESTPGELSASEKVEILRNFAIFARTKLSGLSTGGASTLTEKKDSANATPESDKLLRVVIIQWLQGWVDPTVARGQVKMMKGKVVVEFVETLQNFLDWSKKTDNLSPLFPTPESRQSLAPFLRRCRRCLVSLAKATGELPPSLFVSEGISRPKDPVCIGGFADIFKATYANRSVALKRVRTLARDDRDAKSLRNMFLSETLVWRQLDHPSICPFIGVWREAEIPYMILAWMSNGNAQQYVGDKSISGDVVLQLLIDVADGLVYLHSESVCHGDLCGKNILVDDDGHARLCDFGLSSLFADPRSALYDSNSARLGGTIRWMAPEILSPALGTGMKVTKLTDIYSFGCLGLELYSGRDPHYGTQDRDVIDRVPKGFRPANPGNGRFGRIVPPDVWRMIEQCWQSTPAGRPEASVVLETLKKVQAPTSRPGGVVPQS